MRIIELVLAEAYDPLDPFGNITIKWDVVSWTPDGYVVRNSWLPLPLLEGERLLSNQLCMSIG